MHTAHIPQRLFAEPCSFGYEDGISQPAVQGVDTTVIPQQGTIKQGIALCNRDGDQVSAVGQMEIFGGVNGSSDGSSHSSFPRQC